MKARPFDAAFAAAGAVLLSFTAAVQAESAAPAAVEAVPLQQLQVVRDPVTQRLRAPTAEEAAALAAAAPAARNAGPLTVRTLRNGTRAVRLTPDYLVSLEAERTADGRIQPGHREAGLEAHAATLPTE